MNKVQMIKYFLLGLSLFSLSSCNNEDTSSNETSVPNISHIKPGDSISINKDNFFNYFEYKGYDDYPFASSVYANVKYNIEAEIKVIRYSEYYCYTLNERIETYTEYIYSSTKISDENYQNNESSKFVVITSTNHFEKPTSWEGERYSYNYYKEEYEITKMSGVLTFGIQFYNAETIELTKENYSEHYELYASEITFYGNKTIIEVEFGIPEDLYQNQLLVENPSLELEFILFNEDYSIKTTTEVTLNSFNRQNIVFDKTPHWIISIKDVGGILYVGTNAYHSYF